jgi:hypothetical protein
VPFINNTTGADATALSIAALISVERARKWELDSWEEKGGDFRIHCLGMVTRQNDCFFVKHIQKEQLKDSPNILFWRTFYCSCTGPLTRIKIFYRCKIWQNLSGQ